VTADQKRKSFASFNHALKAPAQGQNIPRKNWNSKGNSMFSFHRILGLSRSHV
jgi:hypothetical protein